MTRIYLDLDDVLIDFSGRACMLHGTTIADLETSKQWTLGQWGLDEALGITDEEFWSPINALKEKFWTSLEWHPWAAALMEATEQMSHKWYLLTSPGKHASAWSGKKKWADRNGLGQRLICTVAKEACAGPNTILIDDRWKNCEDFVAEGGSAICWPAYNNPNHSQRDNPLAFTLHYLEQMIRRPGPPKIR